MSIDDLVRVMARRCGLQDPEEYERRMVTEDPTAIGGLGWTTRMILQALIALEVGATVEISARSETEAKTIREDLHGLKIKAGILIDSRQLYWHWPGAGTGDADIRLVDHAVVLAPAPC